MTGLRSVGHFGSADPREKPYVSHTRGTELIVEHIEKYWCPSILSDDLTRVARGSADPK